MSDPGILAPLGWLIFALGVGVILIAVIPRKTQVHSPTRRLAGALSGAVFCLLAAVVIVPGISGTTQKVLAIGAVVAAALSWYLGRHARRTDRAMRENRKHRL